MKVPPELTDLIIDEVQDDVPTLSSCALVSHDFHPRARLHSFRKITIGHPSKSNSTQSFLRLLVASPHIRWLVRTVVIDAEYGFNEDGSWEDMNQRINTLLWKTAHGRQWVSRDAVLAELLGSLPNLEGFTAGALRWRSSERIPSQVTSFESVLPRRPITNLALNYVHFDSLPSFITILGSFTQLKSLRLGVIIHAPSPGDSVMTLSQGPLGLQEVEMNMEGCASIVELFARSAPVVSSLKRLVLKKCYRGQMELVRELVSSSAGSLEYLHVDDSELPEEFLTRCPPLRVHHIKTLFVGPSSIAAMRWWLDALVNSKGSASQIAEIIFDLGRVNDTDHSTIIRQAVAQSQLRIHATGRLIHLRSY
ncbi:hypothetical protein ARMGADRAFT_1172152 [Armillaria gallica]|uniref:F-box domain-containing protein n=1 Tax=Armillaria gallica TaxID=47427 RepID=A0A2H3CA55_ARMGA|nr:hypothetical protein ARMGADRAFT_1172152 [Armillaria gallica]